MILARDNFILIVGGLLLVITGLIAGEVFALIISHNVNAALEAAWLGVLEHSAAGETDQLAGNFERIRQLATERASSMSLHSHINAYGLLAAALGIARTQFAVRSRFGVTAALLFVVGSAVHSASFLFSSGGGVSAPYALLGAAMLIAATALFLTKRSDAPHELYAPAPPFSCLLRAGIWLVFLGLLFGLYVAWLHVTVEEPAQRAEMDHLFAALSDERTGIAKEVYESFKARQVRMAITAASHSHAVGFGFLFVIAAFLRGHMHLAPGLQKIAKILLVAGGATLPIFVYLAPRFGFTFALAADTAGCLALIGTAILLAGVLVRGIAQYRGAKLR